MLWNARGFEIKTKKEVRKRINQSEIYKMPLTGWIPRRLSAIVYWRNRETWLHLFTGVEQMEYM